MGSHGLKNNKCVLIEQYMIYFYFLRIILQKMMLGNKNFINLSTITSL